MKICKVLYIILRNILRNYSVLRLYGYGKIILNGTLVFYACTSTWFSLSCINFRRLLKRMFQEKNLFAEKIYLCKSRIDENSAIDFRANLQPPILTTFDDYAAPWPKSMFSTSFKRFDSYLFWLWAKIRYLKSHSKALAFGLITYMK